MAIARITAWGLSVIEMPVLASTGDGAGLDGLPQAESSGVIRYFACRALVALESASVPSA